jgi:hypothetical protein
LQLAGPPPQPVPPTAQFRIVRRPRGLLGAAALQLPPDVAIDLTLCRGVSVDARTGAADILFSPAGEVLGAPAGQVILWLLDSSPGGTADSARLVSVYTRTGFIATQPVDVGGDDPYRFTRDGRSSGS